MLQKLSSNVWKLPTLSDAYIPSATVKGLVYMSFEMIATGYNLQFTGVINAKCFIKNPDSLGFNLEKHDSW